VTQKNRALMRESMQELAALECDVILSNSFAASAQTWFEFDAVSSAELFVQLLTRLRD